MNFIYNFFSGKAQGWGGEKTEYQRLHDIFAYKQNITLIILLISKIV
jgi:hypothetical protein